MMWIKNTVFQKDLNYLMSLAYIPWEKLSGRTVLVTGATGLIGYNLICGLIYADVKKKLNIRIIALVRDIERAEKRFAEQLQNSEALTFVSGDVEHLTLIGQSIDYIIHGASPTTSSYFIEHPVETIETSVIGTMNLLRLAVEKQVCGFVYLSSMEVYGETKTEDVLNEKNVGYMNPLIVRNSYSESKRMCENIIISYVSEYHVPAMIVRLAQTFGAGVEKRDTRVFAEFARCAVEKQDIVLLTNGGSKRCYLYTMDAVSAILTVLLKGEEGKAYNAGNPETYYSVKEMACMVAQQIANAEIKVKCAVNLENSKKFPPPHFYNLDIAEIEALGWRVNKNLLEMYKAMIEGWQDEKNSIIGS